MRSIRQKLLVTLLPIIIIGNLFTIGFFMFAIQSSVDFSLNTTVMETTKTASFALENQIKTYKELALQIADDPILSQEIPEMGTKNYETVRNEILNRAEEIANLHNFSAVYVMDQYGLEVFTQDYFDFRQYFIQAKLTMQPYLDDPIIDSITKTQIIYASAPIIRNNEFGGVVFFGIDPSIFSSILAEIKLGKGSQASVINKHGTSIAHSNKEKVFEEENIILLSKNDDGLQAMADMHSDLIAGNSGMGTCTYSGNEILMGYLPVENSNNWGINILVVEDEFLTHSSNITRLGIISAVVVCLLISALAILIATSIAKPAMKATKILPAIAEGDLTVELTSNGNDEVATMMNLFNTCIASTRDAMISIKAEAIKMDDIGKRLSLDSAETASSVHEIATIIESVKSNVTEKAAPGVDSINNLVEEISVNIADLHQKIQKQSENIQDSTAATEEIVANIRSVTSSLEKNSEEVKKLLEAAENGKDSIATTLKITETLTERSEGLLEASNMIASIASQTGLLAMNAAIEAAHAGNAGLGFAVVSDEIRKLAENSSTQSKSINQVLQEVKAGIIELNDSAKFVHNQFDSIFNLISNVEIHEEQMANMMNEQSSANEQVLQSMQDIALITQEVQKESASILTDSNEIKVETSQLNEITELINSSMAEMSKGAMQIRTASENVKDMSNETNTSISTVRENLERFTTEGENA